jgi:hypothetical protein
MPKYYNASKYLENFNYRIKVIGQWKSKNRENVAVWTEPFTGVYANVVCDVTLSVYPHRASLKNMPRHGGNRYDLDSHRGGAYFSSSPGVDIHSE